MNVCAAASSPGFGKKFAFDTLAATVHRSKLNHPYRNLSGPSSPAKNNLHPDHLPAHPFSLFQGFLKLSWNERRKAEASQQSAEKGRFCQFPE